MKKFVCIVLGGVLLFFWSFCGCHNNTTELPGYEQLTKLIGLPKSEVFDALHLEATEFTQDNPITCRLLRKITYCEASFDLFLQFDTDKDALYGFWYVAYYENDAERFTEDAAAVYNALSRDIGKPTSGKMPELKKNSLADKFSGTERFAGDCIWNMTGTLSASGQAYLEYYNTFALEPAAYALTLEATVNPADQIGALYIRSQIVDGYKL